MKILLVTPDYPPNCGGGGIVAYHVSTGISSKGHEIVVITGSLEDNFKVEHKNNLKIIRVPMGAVYLRHIIPSIIYSLPPRWRYIKFLKKFPYDDYDVIHLFAIPTHLLVDIVGIFASKKRQETKIISTIHAFPNYISRKGILPRTLEIAYKLYLLTIGKQIKTESDILTTVSYSTKKDAIALKYSSKSIRVIPNGVEIKTRSEDNKILKLNLKKRDIVITSIGRIVKHKGFEFAISAMKEVIEKYPNVKYVIIGKPINLSYFNYLKELTRKYHLEETVLMTGHISEAKKYQLLARSKIYLSPSLSEGFGLTLLEAMSLGIPVIATDIKGHRDIIKHLKNGVLVKPRDADAIKDAIDMLLSNQKLYKSISVRGQKESLKYSWDNIISLYLELYKNSLGDRHD